MKAKIRGLIRAVPFQSFAIHMEDGRKFVINHPDFIFASPKDQSWIIVIEEKENRWHHLAPVLISGVELASNASTAS